MTSRKFYTESCVHGAPAPCTHFCPLKVDLKKILKKLKTGNVRSAYKEYSRQVVFPSIVSKICHQPCVDNCPASLAIRDLERHLVLNNKETSPETFPVPQKDKTVAIVGAGLSGLSCLLYTARKGYKVTVFESEKKPGGNMSLYMSENDYLNEIYFQLADYLDCIKYGQTINSLKELEEFDSVYISTGQNGNTFGLLDSWDRDTLATEAEGVYIGGSISGCTKIESIAYGIKASYMIDTWLKIHRIEDVSPIFKDDEAYILPELVSLKPEPQADISDIDNNLSTAMAEASRCLNCDCTKCFDTCEYMKKKALMPKDLEVKATNLHGAVTRSSNSIIAGCTLCGHCAAVCKYDVSTEKAMRRGKIALFEDGGFPVAYHDYYMRDMDEAMNEAFFFMKPQTDEHADFVFFPGCQAATTNPEYVTKPYRYIQDKQPSTALLLGCCGVPALFAGDTKKMETVHRQLLEKINEMGNPVIILSCPTCAKTFEEFLPELHCLSIYEFIRQNGLPEISLEATLTEKTWALFDPCSSRQFPEMQDSVRNLLESCGMVFEELKESREHALCCGQGGHIYPADPLLSKKITNMAISQSSLPYITYCTNCRDLFLANNKETVYALDILFNINPLESPVHLKQKHINRYVAIKYLLKEYKGVEYSLPEDIIYPIEIPEAVALKMDSLHISEEEIKDVIMTAEETKMYMINSDTNVRICFKTIGYFTIWVEYFMNESTPVLQNVYCHKMTFNA